MRVREGEGEGKESNGLRVEDGFTTEFLWKGVPGRCERSTLGWEQGVPGAV